MPAPDYADEYAASRARTREVVAGCTPDEAATVVPTCPAWTVHDLCAHLTGVPADLVARRNPGPDQQAWIDDQVAARADRSVAELLDEWDEVGSAFEGLMRKVPRAFGVLVYDAVAHEHDLRGALGRPGARDSDGVAASLEIMAAMVEADLASSAIPGTIRLSAGDQRWEIGSRGPTIAIDTSPWELMRLLGSRRSRAQILDAPWEGDPAPFLPALAHLPLPSSDIVE